MKKSSKIIIAIVVIVAVIVSGCIFAFTRESYGNNKKADVVLITNGSTIDENIKTYNLWMGVKEYAKSCNLKANYIVPEIDDIDVNDAVFIEGFYTNYIDKAVENGAKYIVLSDESFAVTAYSAGMANPDVKFLLIDAFPHSQDDDTMRTLTNVMPVKFDYTQAGFLAGYSCVQDGSLLLWL